MRANHDPCIREEEFPKAGSNLNIGALTGPRVSAATANHRPPSARNRAGLTPLPIFASSGTTPSVCSATSASADLKRLRRSPSISPRTRAPSPPARSFSPTAASRFEEPGRPAVLAPTVVFQKVRRLFLSICCLSLTPLDRFACARDDGLGDFRPLMFGAPFRSANRRFSTVCGAISVRPDFLSSPFRQKAFSTVE